MAKAARVVHPTTSVKVLVIDVGGTHVKMTATGARESRGFSSGRQLTPAVLARKVRRVAADWDYEAIALGYPGAANADGPTAEPGNLGNGWVGFDFTRAFKRPVRITNDAVMQALGGYKGGRMLFLGLGTGLGSALVTERVIVPLELGCLPYTGRESIADRLGRRGRQRHGVKAWQRAIARIVPLLRAALTADYVVLGGGNARHVDPLPASTTRGGNEDAFIGGFRLWEDLVEPHDREAAPVWRVVR
jgi:predicted NBD/HSP70 family sugar kinase